MDQAIPTLSASVSIRPLREHELDEADRIFRLAFGTFIGLPDPMDFMKGAKLVPSRWRADPCAFLGADLDGTLVGSNGVTTWGSVGFFGPLTVRPELWDRGIGQRLLEPAMQLFRDRGTREVGLFTFPHSPKHIGLYQKYGFWPRSLTAVMRRHVRPVETPARASLLSQLPDDARAQSIDACLELGDAVRAGLDLRPEIRGVLANANGDTGLLWDTDRLEAFALCHCGPGSEAEDGTCYVKFGACRPGPRAEANLGRLLDECERFAAGRSAEWLVAGANAARRRAYGAMLDGGFAPQLFGVAMHLGNEPGYCREEVLLVDDWR